MRRKRLLMIGATFVVLLAITVVGTLMPLGSEDAESLRKRLEETRQDIQSMHLLPGTLYIFRNNFLIDLIMFVPIVGPAFGAYVTYNTGLVIGVESADAGISPLLVLLVLFILPFAWMEFIAYSIAFSESVWLVWSIRKRRFKHELVNALILLLTCLVILLVAAFLEMAIIKSLV